MKSIWIECKGAKIRQKECFYSPFNRLIKTFRRFRFEFWTFTFKRIAKQYFISEDLGRLENVKSLPVCGPAGCGLRTQIRFFTRTLVHYKHQAHFFYLEMHMLNSQLEKWSHLTSEPWKMIKISYFMSVFFMSGGQNLGNST